MIGGSHDPAAGGEYGSVSVGWTSVRADQDSGPGLRDVTQLELAGSAVIGEQPLTAPEEYGFDHEAVLVDEAVGDEIPDEGGASHDLQGAAVLSTEVGDRAHGIIRRQERGVRPREILFGQRA